jgi:hypothetical protein
MSTSRPSNRAKASLDKPNGSRAADFSAIHAAPRASLPGSESSLEKIGGMRSGEASDPAPAAQHLFPAAQRALAAAGRQGNLIDHYRDDIQNLSALPNKDLNAWLT